MMNMKNPIQSIANVVEHLHSSVQAAKAKVAHDQSIKATQEGLGVETKYVDLVIKVSLRYPPCCEQLL